MKSSYKSLIIAIIGLTVGSGNLFGQNNYLAEIGVHSGASALWNRNSNDWNYSPLTMSGMFLRYNPNDRFSLQLNYENAPWIGGNFSGQSMELNSIFNMLELGQLDYKLYSKDYSPYLLFGLGTSFFHSQSTNLSNAIFLPVGVGLRINLKKRFNLNFQFNHRFYLSSNRQSEIDYMDYNIIRNSTNILNNSQLSSLSVGLSYDFWERACDCMKEKEQRNKRFNVRTKRKY